MKWSLTSCTGLGQEIKHIYKTPGVLNTIVHPYWAATPLVGGYEDYLEKNQGKLLKPENIGKKIVDQVLSCRGGQVIIPEDMKIAPGVRGHPNWLQELIRDNVIGKASASMPKVPQPRQ
jgi:all-trans-retinol dehydrogenase (NAD+)